MSTSSAQKDLVTIYIPGTTMCIAPQPHHYIIKHQGCWYHCTRHHIHTIEFSAHNPITRSSQPQQHSSTEPTRKSCILRPSAVPTHGKHAASLETAIPRPLSMTNKTASKWKTNHYKSIQHKIMHSKTFFALETQYLSNRAIHSSHHKC